MFWYFLDVYYIYVLILIFAGTLVYYILTRIKLALLSTCKLSLLFIQTSLERKPVFTTTPI